MPTPTYIPIANITLSSNASSVVFSSITQAYRDLILVVDAGNSGNVYNGLRGKINNDSAANYRIVYALGNGSSTISSAESTSNMFLGATGATNSATTVQFIDYSATDKHKTTLIRRSVADASGYSLGMEVGRWASTSAITSIELFDQSGYSLDSGSTFTLYGVAA